MMKFFTEAEEDMNMDVQVGPQEEIEAEVEPCNAVEVAKKDPATVVVAAVEKNEGCNEEGCCREFYVDAKDVEKYAELSEQSMLEALNDIIVANEDAGMEASNLIVVMSEGTEGYTRNLEAHGAVCMFTEASDINVDVQVGPNEEELSVQEDPQTANPLDVVKKDYDTVVVAQDGDEFFTDVEDVQKCADLNCESVIKTLNGIIAANEASGICADNIVVYVSESTREDTLNALSEAGVRVSDISGFGKISMKLVAICKKIAGKFKKNVNADDEAIQYQIKKCDEAIERCNEELKKYDETKKISLSYALKLFVGFAERLAVSMTIGGAVGLGVGSGLEKLGGATNAQIKDAVKPAIKGSLPLFAKLEAAGTIILTGEYLVLYKEGINVFKKNFEDEKKRLEKCLK